MQNGLLAKIWHSDSGVAIPRKEKTNWFSDIWNCY